MHPKYLLSHCILMHYLRFLPPPPIHSTSGSNPYMYISCQAHARGMSNPPPAKKGYGCALGTSRAPVLPGSLWSVRQFTFTEKASTNLLVYWFLLMCYVFNSVWTSNVVIHYACVQISFNSGIQ